MRLRYRRQEMLTLVVLAVLIKRAHLIDACANPSAAYRYEPVFDDPQTWVDAGQTCRGKGGCLARPTRQSSLVEMMTYLPSDQNPKEYWVGIRYDQNTGKFKWSNDVEITPTPEFNIIVNRNQQMNSKFRKRCLMITNKNKLKAEDCVVQRKFLCQKPKDASSTTPATSVSTHTSLSSSSSKSSSATPRTLTSRSTPRRKPSKHTTSSIKITDSPTRHTRPRTRPSRRITTPSEKPSGKALVKSYINSIRNVDAKDPNSLDDAMNITTMLLVNLKHSGKENNKGYVMGASLELEKFGMKYAKQHLRNNTSTKAITVKRKGFFLAIQKVNADAKQDLEVPPRGNTSEKYNDDMERRTFISLPSKIFKGQDRFVVSAVYSDVTELLSSRAQAIIDGELEENTNTEMYSDIISCTLYPRPEGLLPENVTITLHHIKESSHKDKPNCVFWDIDAKTELKGSWSRQGCSAVESNSNRTVCTCNHLTSFALLMQVDEGKPVSEGHKVALQVITFVGCGLSLAGELLTVLAYLLLMNIKLEQSQIRLNLVVSLAVAQIFFLSGINATANQGVCIFVAVMIHYMYLVAFGWMMLEGLFLYLMVVKVFNTVVKMKLYYAFAWGFPVLMILLSIAVASSLEDGINSYTNNEFCWVSFSNGLVWTFVAPVLLISLVNMIVLVRVVCEMTRLQSVKSSDANNAKQGVKACIILFPLLGLTWVFGILAVTESGLAFQYIFTILNSLQGFLIFILHVLRSGEMRNAFQRKRKQWESTKGTEFVTAKSTTDNSVSYTDRQLLKNMGNKESLKEVLGKRNQVVPSPTLFRGENRDLHSRTTCITPIETPTTGQLNYF